jgi:hypothetical protein
MDAAELSGAIAAEQRLLDPAVRADPAAVAELLDDDFTEIGQTGTVWTRAAVIEALAAELDSRSVVEASGWAVREIAPQLALVGFETRKAGVRVRRTTLWRLRDGAWRAVAHQGTRIVD